MDKSVNILIVGVGGQGTLLASRIIGAIAALHNKDCKLSEVHGMSQRGGSVVTYAKIADKVTSPIIAEGDADYVLAFEKLEALRWIHYLKPNGTVIVNTQEIYPMPVITGAAKYPDDVINQLKARANVISVDALGVAETVGNVKTVNTVMLAVLCKELGLNKQLVATAYQNTVAPKLLDINLLALSAGYEL